MAAAIQSIVWAQYVYDDVTILSLTFITAHQRHNRLEVLQILKQLTQTIAQRSHASLKKSSWSWISMCGVNRWYGDINFISDRKSSRFYSTCKLYARRWFIIRNMWEFAGLMLSVKVHWGSTDLATIFTKVTRMCLDRNASLVSINWQFYSELKEIIALIMNLICFNLKLVEIFLYSNLDSYRLNFYAFKKSVAKSSTFPSYSAIFINFLKEKIAARLFLLLHFTKNANTFCTQYHRLYTLQWNCVLCAARSSALGDWILFNRPITWTFIIGEPFSLHSNFIVMNACALAPTLAAPRNDQARMGITSTLKTLGFL